VSGCGLAESGLVGGFHGAWLAPPEVDSALSSRACLDAHGALTGAGGLIVQPPGASGMVETARIAAYPTGQSAEQCGPCLNGLPRMADLLARVAAGDRDPGLVGELHGLPDSPRAAAPAFPRRHHAAGPQRAVRLRTRSLTRSRVRDRSGRVSTLHIDWTRCRGRGGCVELLGELIGPEKFGYPVTAADTVVPRGAAAGRAGLAPARPEPDRGPRPELMRRRSDSASMVLRLPPH
jgi:hypothetical protein